MLRPRQLGERKVQMRVMHHSVSHRHVVKMDLNFDEEILQIEITQTVQHCIDSVEDSPLRSSGLIWVSFTNLVGFY